MLLHLAVGHTKWPANRIPLSAKSLSKQNQPLPLYILHRLAQGKDDTM